MNYKKKKIFILIVILLIITGMSIILINKPNKEVLSTTLNEKINGAIEIKQATVKNNVISYSFKLPNYDSTISYKIKIKNQGEYNSLLKSLELLDNDTVGYEIDGFDDEKIKSGKIKTIIITFSSKNGGSDDIINLDIKLNIDTLNKDSNKKEESNNTNDSENDDINNGTTNNNSNNNDNSKNYTNQKKKIDTKKNNDSEIETISNIQNDKSQDIKKYYVIYKTDSAITGEYVNEGSKVNPPVVQVKTFKYWSLKEDGEKFDLNTKINSNTILYAVYEIENYTVSFIDDEQNEKKIIVEKNNKINQDDIPIVSKDGYVFTGWSLDKENLFDFNTSINEDIKLYSTYKNITYGVSFDDDNRITIKDVNYGDVVEKLESQGKEGYTFKYWSIDKQTEFDFTTSIKSPITLYAVYEANKYMISYDNDGQILTETKEVIYNQKYDILKEVSKEGYTFVGWYTSKTGGIKITENSTVNILEDTTLYARYNINIYTLTINTNNDVDNKVYNLKYKETKQIDNPEKVGYTFTGWTLEGAGSLLNQTTFTMGYENASLVANYEPSVYTVTLNSSNATTQGTSMIYQRYNTGIYLDSTLTTSMTTSSNNINIPSKSGYIFGGYYTEENGSGKMIIDENGYITDSITSTTYKNNITLYAKWTRLTASMINYTDTYNIGCSDVQCAIDKIKNILDN